MAQQKGKSYYFDHAATNFITENGVISEFKLDENQEININGVRRKDVEELDDTKFLDFKFSFDNIQFQDEREKRNSLSIISRKILELQTEYTSGKRVRKNDLTGAIISIHTEKKKENVSIDNQNTVLEPHIHLVIPRSKISNFGPGYFFLKKAIINIIHESGLSSSINTKFEKKDEKSYQILKDRLTAFSWALEKHNKDELRKYFEKKEVHKLSVTLENIEVVLQAYLDMKGSVSLARKIALNLAKKLGITIKCKVESRYREIKKDLEDNKYEEIIRKVSKMIVNKEKLPEILKFYKFCETGEPGRVNKRDIIMKNAIRALYKHRGYYIDENNRKIINVEKINCIAEKALKELKIAKREKEIDEIIRYLSLSTAKNEKELADESEGRLKINKRGEIVFEGVTYKFSEVLGMTKGHYFYLNSKVEVQDYIMRKYRHTDIYKKYVHMTRREMESQIREDIFGEIKYEMKIRGYSESWTRASIKELIDNDVVGEIQEMVLEKRKSVIQEEIDAEREIRKKLKEKVEGIMYTEVSLDLIANIKNEIKQAKLSMKYPEAMSFALRKLESRRYELMKTDIVKNPEKYFDMNIFNEILAERHNALVAGKRELNAGLEIKWAAKASLFIFQEVPPEIVNYAVNNVEIFKEQYINAIGKENIRRTEMPMIIEKKEAFINDAAKKSEEYSFVWRGKNEKIRTIDEGK